MAPFQCDRVGGAAKSDFKIHFLFSFCWKHWPTSRECVCWAQSAAIITCKIGIWVHKLHQSVNLYWSFTMASATEWIQGQIKKGCVELVGSLAIGTLKWKTIKGLPRISPKPQVTKNTFSDTSASSCCLLLIIYTPTIILMSYSITNWPFKPR